MFMQVLASWKLGLLFLAIAPILLSRSGTVVAAASDMRGFGCSNLNYVGC